jgi:hypothetical protein
MGDERGDDAADRRRADVYSSARIGAAAALTIVLVVLLVLDVVVPDYHGPLHTAEASSPRSARIAPRRGRRIADGRTKRSRAPPMTTPARKARTSSTPLIGSPRG